MQIIRICRNAISGLNRSRGGRGEKADLLDMSGETNRLPSLVKQDIGQTPAEDRDDFAQIASITMGGCVVSWRWEKHST